MHGSLHSIESPARALSEVPSPRAVGVRVQAGVAAAGAEGLQVHEPTQARLVQRRVSLETALSEDQSNDLLTLIFIPAGNFELQRQAELWMASRAGEHGAAVEIPFRSERILWRPGRALIIGRGELLQEVQQALSYLSFCEAELGKLERQVGAQWTSLEADVTLTHSVSSSELSQQKHVDTRTAAAHRMRIAFVRLDTALERLDAVLPPPAQRVFSELAVQRDFADRLRLLDDAIEVAQEVYDTANDRLSEYRYFSREYRIEVGITLILLAELVVMALEAWRHWQG